MIWRFIRSAAWVALLATSFACAVTTGAHAQARGRGPARTAVHVDISIFYNDLAPYGHWFAYGSYGWAWTPYDMPYGWRPYTHGHWIYTDCGWTWVSDYRWGWAPFHYGRWLFDPDYGWIWIPDTIWGPAWVAWRWSDDWVGWCPLPPRVGWQVGVGLRFGDARERWEPDAACWSFTRPRWMLNPSVRYKLEPMGRNVTLIGRTRLVADYDEMGGHPRNRGRDVREFEKLVGRPVPRFKMMDAASPLQAERAFTGNQARFFRPEVAPAPDKRPVMREPRTPPPSPRAEKLRRDEEQRKVDSYYRQEQWRLESQQRMDTRNPAPPTRDELARQHEQEKRSLNEQKAREERVRQERIDKRIEKPAPARPAKPEKDKGGKGRGNH